MFKEDLEDKTVPELDEILEEYDLPKTGLKADKIKRLEKEVEKEVEKKKPRERELKKKLIPKDKFEVLVIKKDKLILKDKNGLGIERPLPDKIDFKPGDVIEL